MPQFKVSNVGHKTISTTQNLVLVGVWAFLYDENVFSVMGESTSWDSFKRVDLKFYTPKWINNLYV